MERIDFNLAVQQNVEAAEVFRVSLKNQDKLSKRMLHLVVHSNEGFAA